MIVVDPKSVVDIEKAQELIESFQIKLMQCEMHLEDLARCAEIATITKQFHLLDSFVNVANEYLADKLEMPEEEPQDMKIRIITDDAVSDKPS
jgi:hypothetical protein